MNISAKYLMLDFANKSGQLKPIDGDEKCHLHQVLTQMLSDIQTVCEDNGITVMASYGTALGAYRHGGFIPWDDDADVCMLRSDWEKFRDSFDDLFKGRYVLEAPQYGNQDTQTTWGKIYMPNTQYVEIFNEATPYHKGLFVDVFIIDALSDNPLVRKFDMLIAKLLKSAISSMTYYHYPGKTLVAFMSSNKTTKLYFRLRQFLGFLMSFKSHKQWCDIYDRFVSRHSNTKLTITDYNDIITGSDEWLPVSKIKFENIMINVPNNIEKYLERAYGPDYMQLPPEDKREQHFCVKLDFGEF